MLVLRVVLHRGLQVPLEQNKQGGEAVGLTNKEDAENILWYVTILQSMSYILKSFTKKVSKPIEVMRKSCSLAILYFSYLIILSDIETVIIFFYEDRSLWKTCLEKAYNFFCHQKQYYTKKKCYGCSHVTQISPCTIWPILFLFFQLKTFSQNSTVLQKEM